MALGVKTGSLNATGELPFTNMKLVGQYSYTTNPSSTEQTITFGGIPLVPSNNYFLLFDHNGTFGPVSAGVSYKVQYYNGETVNVNFVSKDSSNLRNDEGEVTFNAQASNPNYGSITLRNNSMNFRPNTVYNILLYEVQ